MPERDDAILVLDDDVEVSQVLADFLRSRGQRALVAHTGAAALATLAETPIALVLLDLHLPDVPGRVVMAESQKAERPPEVVIVTGHADLESAIAALDAGAGGYVVKPIDLDRLATIVGRILERRRLRKDNERLSAEIGERLRETEALLAVASTVSSTLDTREALRRICRELTRLIGADTGAVYLYEAASDRLVAAAGYHVPAHMLESFLATPLPLRDQGFYLPIWQERRAVFTDDVARDQRFTHEIFRRHPHQSGLVLPLTRDGEVAGAIYLVWWTERRRFAPRELAMVESAVGQAAVLVQNAQLFERAREREREITRLYEETRAHEARLAQLLDAERELSRMKRDFVSFATHQLRTPLAGIRWMLELTAQESLPEGPAAFVADARAAAERLNGLVNDLLDVSRLESENLPIELRETDVAELTRSVLEETMLPDDKRHRVSLTVAPRADLAALADPQLLREVLRHLVSNAVKYTPSGGDISIGIDADDRQVKWSIRDNGIGIPAAAQGRLFEKFYRADNAAQVETESTGLGLYIVRLIAQHLGGRVWCESEEDRGTTFYLTMPRAVAVAQGDA